MPRSGFSLRLSLLVVAVSCGKPAPSTVDAGVDDASPDPDGPTDAAVDADAPPEVEIPDTDPPQLLGVTPTGSAWLHEPIRFEIDETIVAPNLAVSASINGTPVAATVAIVPGGLDPAGHAIAVTIDPAARAVGTLAVALSGDIFDDAGNKMVAGPLAAEVTLPAWYVPAVDRGVATDSPSLAVASTGDVTAAWLVGAATDRRVAVSRHERGAWQALGALRGSADIGSASITVDAMDRPVVAWVEGNQVHVERWTGTAWQALASPGVGTSVVLASAPGADPVIAVAGSAVSVRTLVADSWQPVGADLVLPGTLVGEPVLAAAAGNRIAVGWIDNTGGVLNVRAFRYATSWVTMTPMVLGAAPAGGIDRMSLAARDQTIAIAWDRWDRSFNVYAAIATGDATTTWTKLGRPLDIDQPGDAVAPAIALDTSGAPIVAWEEKIEGTQRGVIARWDGTAWRIVGGPTWMTTTGTPTHTSLALHAGEAPVVGWSAGGTVGIAEHNGPKVAQLGMTTRSTIAGCAINPLAPVARVMQTGCFTLPTASKPDPHPGLVPYDLNAELWSDGTKKRRWIALPDGGTMTQSATGAWAAPVGTMIVKEFAIETTPGDSTTRRPVETRFLVHTDTGWMGFTYRWRLDGTDADLLSDQGVTYTWPLSNGSTYTHYYPSRTQCRSCHHTSFGPLLGLRPEQLQRKLDYKGVIAEQLPTLAQLGVGPDSSATPLPSPYDPHEVPAARVRAYMAGNCAHCHNASYISIKDMRFTTPLAQTRLCEVITPGSPSASRLHDLVSSRPGMPPLGTLQVDPLAVELVDTWITGLTSCP